MQARSGRVRLGCFRDSLDVSQDALDAFTGAPPSRQLILGFCFVIFSRLEEICDHTKFFNRVVKLSFDGEILDQRGLHIFSCDNAANRGAVRQVFVRLMEFGLSLAHVVLHLGGLDPCDGDCLVRGRAFHHAMVRVSCMATQEAPI